MCYTFVSGDIMKITDIVRKYKQDDFKDREFVEVLNEIANYVMYEQAIVKKDNDDNNSTIKYSYDEKSYKFINYFFSKIEFLSKPVIGSAKKVNIKNLPDKYKSEGKHVIPFSDKVYLLDKIKDSFMHLNGDETLYEINYNEKVILIKNITPMYSLECKIPFKDLYVFNRTIKYYYDNSAPALEWIDEFFNGKNQIYINYKIPVKGYNKLFEMRLPSNRRVLYVPGTDCYFFYERADIDGVKSLSKKEYDSYFTDSYISLLMASKDDMNYPLLESLYQFDFHCEHKAYVPKMESIVNKIISFYNYIYSNIDYLNYDFLKQKILEFIYHTSQNGKKDGLLVDISDVNNLIVKKYMRNARSHANNKGIIDSSFANEVIIYYDVAYNSLQNKISDKTIPSFVLTGKRKELNNFFDEITKNSKNNQELYDQIVNGLSNDNYDSYEMFLHQVEIFIEQASKDKIKYADVLKTPIGNASNFVDFIRKIMKGTFEYEEGKGIKRKI